MDLDDKHSAEWGELKEEVNELKQLLRAVGAGTKPPSKKKEPQRRLINYMQGDISDELQRGYWESGAEDDNRSSIRSPRRNM